MRLSSGPEHSLLTNRPVIVTQSVLPSSPPLPLQKRGSPYSDVVRRAATVLRNATPLPARPHQLQLDIAFDRLKALGNNIRPKHELSGDALVDADRAGRT